MLYVKRLLIIPLLFASVLSASTDGYCRGWRRCFPRCSSIVFYETVKLPLCPKLAELSYGDVNEGKGKVIGRYLAEQAEKRGIRINPLSPFVAEFSGPACEIEWLKENYPPLVCAFNSALVPDPADVYSQSMRHVRGWMNLVEQGELEELMNSQYLYCHSCCLDFKPRP